MSIFFSGVPGWAQASRACLEATTAHARTMGFWRAQLWGELLEVMRENLEHSVRPLGSWDLCTVAQTLRTPGSGSDPFLWPCLRTCCRPPNRCHSATACTPPMTGSSPLLRQPTRVWGVRFCLAVNAADNCNSLPWPAVSSFSSLLACHPRDPGQLQHEAMPALCPTWFLLLPVAQCLWVALKPSQRGSFQGQVA